MLDRAFRFFTSLKLTVVCLAVAIVLVFAGTLAQQHLGLHDVQSRYFQSFFVWWGPAGARWQIPIFPGGYLVGGLLLLNLLAAYARRGAFVKERLGLLMVHTGLVLLLAGQLLTDALSKESAMRFAEGQSKNYSEAFREAELAVIDKSDPETDLVASVPESMLARKGEIRLPGLPLSLRVEKYWPNVTVLQKPLSGSVASGATQGVGANLRVLPKRPVSGTDERNVPAAVVEIFAGPTSLGKWLTSFGLEQSFTHDGRSYALDLRPTRFYTPFSVELLRTTHEVYPGSDIPKNFQSRVRIENPARREAREVDIYMNNPLRYGGLTFYQYQMGRDELDANRGTSVLQVVRNPGWLTPYVGCVMVGAGLLVQFLMHLVGFTRERRTA